MDRKGRKVGRPKGLSVSDFSQIPCFEWPLVFRCGNSLLLVNYSSMLHLDDFEIISLKELTWFQTLAHALASRESLPDCFHIWTAHRNELDVFLTLEKKLPRVIEQLNNRRRTAIDVGVAVLRPTKLLELLGVAEIDAVPIDFGPVLYVHGDLPDKRSSAERLDQDSAQPEMPSVLREM